MENQIDNLQNETAENQDSLLSEAESGEPAADVEVPAEEEVVVAEETSGEEDDVPVAYCGLYCGKCRNFVQKKCEGCIPDKQFHRCKIKRCCKENGYRTCADCQIEDLEKCKKFNNFMSGVFSKMMSSDRKANIAKLKELGIEEYSKYMKVEGLMSIRKKK